MSCRWRDRPNLREYCSTCGNGTKSGCLLDGISTHRDHHAPAEFPKGAGS